MAKKKKRKEKKKKKMNSTRINGDRERRQVMIIKTKNM